jgi:hypothetical protein
VENRFERNLGAVFLRESRLAVLSLSAAET